GKSLLATEHPKRNVALEMFLTTIPPETHAAVRKIRNLQLNIYFAFWRDQVGQQAMRDYEQAVVKKVLDRMRNGLLHLAFHHWLTLVDERKDAQHEKSRFLNDLLFLPIPFIVRKGQVMLLKMMMRNLGDQVNDHVKYFRDDAKRTLVHLAAQDGRIAMVEFLLAMGVNATLKDKQGETALHAAMELKNQKLIDILIRAGCDPTMPDAQGKLYDDPMHFQTTDS
ncbi:hypothetical protein CYMTET_35511, partial [Cymbomonas tetramitiformis]